MSKSYTSTHNHTEFSNLKLIDSINRVEELIQYAYDLGLNGVAITDHDCISGHVRAWNYYNKMSDEQRQNFKLILGNEIYLCRDDLTAANHQKGEKFYHLILLAKDDEGYSQIRQLSSRAWGRAYMKNIMRTPTFSNDLFDIIGNNPGHVISTTACLGGYCGTKFDEGDYAAIERHLGMMQDLFGIGNFYIELQPSWHEDQIKYNKYMIATYWNKYPFILATDSHYLNETDREIHKVFLNSKSSGDRETDKFYASAYMMGYDEVREYFISDKGTCATEEQFEIMCENTNRIGAEVGTYNLKHTSIIPHIDYEEESIDSWYSNLINKYGAETEYIQKMIDKGDKADIYMLNRLVEPWSIKIDLSNELKYVVELNYECEQLYKISEELQQSMSNYFITMAKMIDIMWNEADSIVGPARGSAGSSIINYLLGITQIDPLDQPIELPFWRFIHAERPGLPDIDIDTEASKRLAVFNKVQQYFNSLGGDLIHVCTFGTEKSKGAINTAVKGLELDDDLAAYLTAMVPNARGFDWTLKQCYYGDDEHQAIANFRDEMNKNPLLWKVASRIEGLITSLGCHASGVLALNDDVWKTNSVMKTSKGVLVTAFDLEDTEQLGGVKYDYLTVQALDKIRVCMNWLLENEYMEWQGSLRATYDKYLAPKVINKTDKGMWESLYRKEIPSCFQFDTVSGGQAVQLIRPQNLLELLTGNSVLRLMAEEGKEQPLNIYASYKRNIDLWYEEMRLAGLTDDEQHLLEKYLLPVYGVAASQELMMRLSMDPHIAGFSIGEANILRKAVAKKKRELLDKGKELFYTKGQELGTSINLLNYVWDVQIMRQAGYSFSDIHTTAYSYIAIQEMNLSYFYPSIYWKTACLSVDAGAVNVEDFYNLVNTGILQLADEDDMREQTKVKYGQIAYSIIKFRQYGNVELPNISSSRFGFTPNEERNSIMYGLRGIARIGEQIIRDIIINQPYSSVQDFVKKMTTSDGKKLISKDKVVNLIKAGAFDTVENKPREQILKEYVMSVADQKQKLNLMNFQMLIRMKMVPDELAFTVKVYNFTKYIRTMRFVGNYILDENGLGFYSENYDMSKVKYLEKEGSIVAVIGEKYWDNIYNIEMDKARSWIKKNHDELLMQLNKRLFDEEYEKYGRGDINQWELDALSFYYSGHPLQNLSLPLEITPISELVENEFDGFWMIKGKRVPKYKLRSIIGTVVDKDKQNGFVTIQTPDNNIIEIKVYKQQFARFTHIISNVDDDGNKDILEDSFFEKGTHLLVTGILRGNVFVPKVYKDTGFEAILKIILKEDGTLDYFMRKSE